MNALHLNPTAYSGTLDAVALNAAADQIGPFNRQAEEMYQLVHERNVARKQTREAAKAVKRWRRLTYTVLILVNIALLLMIWRA